MNGIDCIREWKTLEELFYLIKKLQKEEREVTIANLGTILGRTYEEVSKIYTLFYRKTQIDFFN